MAANNNKIQCSNFLESCKQIIVRKMLSPRCHGAIKNKALHKYTKMRCFWSNHNILKQNFQVKF